MEDRPTGKIRGRFRQARLDYQSRVGRTVTIADAAQMLGMKRQSLSDLENDKTLPLWPTLTKICHLYGLQPGDLVWYDEEDNGDRSTRYAAQGQLVTA